MLAPALGPPAVRHGQRNAPAQTRNTNNIQTTEHTSAAVTGACDDSSELQPSSKIIVAGDVKVGQDCRAFFDSWQNYGCGISKGDLEKSRR